MNKTTQSITVMEPVTYETSVMVGFNGPTLSDVYELNGWPVSKCQPFHGIGDSFLCEPHQGARKCIRDVSWLAMQKDPTATRKAAAERTWFIGGIDKPVNVAYFPLLPQDAEAFGIDRPGEVKRTLWVEHVVRESKLNVTLPEQVRVEIARAEDSGLFRACYSWGPSFLAISYDWRVFEMKPIPKPDPIIIGWGHDYKWHVIAAWNIDLDLAAIAETQSQLGGADE